MTIDSDCFYISDQNVFWIKVIDINRIKVIYLKEYFYIQTLYLKLEVIINTNTGLNHPEL